MSTRHRLSAALVAVLLLAALTACADRGGDSDPAIPIAPTQGAVMTGTVEVPGGISKLSVSGADDAYILTMADFGMLPVVFAEDVTPQLRAGVAIIAVPANFDTSLRGAELFAALNDLSQATNSSLTVLEVVPGFR